MGDIEVTVEDFDFDDEKEEISEEDIPQEGIATDYIDGYEDEEQEKMRVLIERLFPLPEDWPSETKIEEWRKKFKNIRIRRANPFEAYIVRPLLRSELPGYYRTIKQAGEDSNDVIAQLKVEEELVSRCTLWPRLTIADIRGEGTSAEDIDPIAIAGTASVLAADILYISRMLDDSVGPVEDL